MDEFLASLTSRVPLQVLARREGIRFADERGQSREMDVTLRVRAPDGQELLMAVECKETVYPRDARSIVEQFGAYESGLARDDLRAPLLRVVVASHLSEGARLHLRKSSINYFDSSGTLYLRHGTWFVDVERSPKAMPKRQIGSLFDGARERVVHALLRHWRRTQGNDYASGIELAESAGTSAYTVSKTMTELERQAWIQTQGAGPTQRRRLCAPAELLDAWAEAWTRRTETLSRWYGYAPEGILRPITEGLADRDGWALTGAAAANTLVPHLSRVDRVMVIVPPGRSDDWADELKLKQAPQGANVLFVERTGASLQFIDDSLDRPGVRLASPFVQYLDLLDGAGRNKELAAEFRERYLKIGDSHGD